MARPKPVHPQPGAAFPASKWAHFRGCLPLSHRKREKGGLSRDVE
ncbi:hypothetical protein ACFOET_11140 [Parapedobacter deserti]|uniref:Uncharacterized protein n=1 Tax=Parapedobacter deserti TaxID=1912957 RepID=A0ABV7JJE4_9SPHI